MNKRVPEGEGSKDYTHTKSLTHYKHSTQVDEMDKQDALASARRRALQRQKEAALKELEEQEEQDSGDETESSSSSRSQQKQQFAARRRQLESEYADEDTNEDGDAAETK
mgnify:CR=1 FL=1